MSFLHRAFSHLNHIRRRVLTEERGLTLVEELVTVAIIGMGLVILVAMITTGTVGVQKIRDRTVADNLARSQLELIQDAAYEPDPTSSPYPAVSSPPAYQVSVQIEYWDASSDTFTGGVRNDGMQKITVNVTSDGDIVSQISAYKVDR